MRLFERIKIKRVWEYKQTRFYFGKRICNFQNDMFYLIRKYYCQNYFDHMILIWFPIKIILDDVESHCKEKKIDVLCFSNSDNIIVKIELEVKLSAQLIYLISRFKLAKFRILIVLLTFNLQSRWFKIYTDNVHFSNRNSFHSNFNTGRIGGKSTHINTILMF